jgi:Transcriptional regulator
VEAVPVKSANRAIDIFELLASESHGLTVAEIGDKLGLARSSAHGLVRTLHSRGYLTEDGARRYHLGARLIQLGLNVADRLECEPRPGRHSSDSSPPHGIRRYLWFPREASSCTSTRS